MEKKVVLITGASAGIGLDTARLLAENGFTVYGAARRTEPLRQLAPLGVKAIRMDVTDEESVRDGLNILIAAEGRIDILINNAGYGSFGAIEEVPISEAERQLQVNVFGAMRLVQLVLPFMRRQKSGRIINTSSIAGRFAMYFGGWYHASKYAMEGLSDSLRMELRQFGIDVVLIEPGGIKTDWGIIAANHLRESCQGTPYQAEAMRCANLMEKGYSSNFLSNPKVVAKAMLRACTSRHPKARYRCGRGSTILVLLHTILPARWFDRLAMLSI